MDLTALSRIRELNDAFRKTFQGGRIVVTPGFVMLPKDLTTVAITAVKNFDEFDDANDPYGEHDFGTVLVEGYQLVFKIDYYSDRKANAHSEDPSDPAQTFRVMTIMRPDEY